MGLLSVLVFLVPVILIKCPCACVPAEATCTIPSVERGKMTTLTCYFNKNMQENRGNIVVVHQTNAFAEREDILDCYWKDNNYKCKTFLPHLRINSSIGENLTLELLQAGEEDVGNYSCVIVPENSDAYTCSFSLRKSVSMAAGTVDTVTEDKEVISDTTVEYSGKLKTSLKEPPEGQDEDKGGGTTAIIGGVIGALMAVVLVGLVIWKRDLLLAACDKKKSASLKEQDAEEMPLQVLATKEKTLDEKPQAAVTDGGDKSTSETPAVTVHPTDGSDIPVHCGQGEGGCRRAEEAQNPEKDPILHSSPSASLSTGPQPGNHLNQPSVEEDGSETGDQPRAGHVRAVCAVFEGLKDSSDDKCRKNTCWVQSGTDLGITLYAFDVQASSAPPAPGKSVLTVRHTAVIHPEERSRSVAERTEPKLRFESNSGTGSCLF